MNGLKQNTFKSCNKVQGGWSIHTRYGFDIVFLICKLQKNPVSKKKKKKPDCNFFASATSPSSKYTNTGKKKKQDSSKLRAASFSLPVTLVSEGSESWGAWHPVTIATLIIMHEPLSYSPPFTYTYTLAGTFCWHGWRSSFWGRKTTTLSDRSNSSRALQPRKLENQTRDHTQKHTPHQKASK